MAKKVKCKICKRSFHPKGMGTHMRMHKKGEKIRGIHKKYEKMSDRQLFDALKDCLVRLLMDL